MYKTLLVLSLGLASSTVFANTGSINFHGQVDSGTCPIEIIDPQTGLPMSRIHMGNVNSAQFDSIGDEAASRAFSMRLTPGGACTVASGDIATVTFTGAYGGAGGNGDLYALQPDGATGLALVIKDVSGTTVANGAKSSPYNLDDTKPTDMLFSAAYKSTLADVKPGHANTDIQFNVEIP